VGVDYEGCRVAGWRVTLEVREVVLEPAQHTREHHLPLSGAQLSFAAARLRSQPDSDACGAR
jgi:hypothetical protein